MNRSWLWLITLAAWGAVAYTWPTRLIEVDDPRFKYPPSQHHKTALAQITGNPEQHPALGGQYRADQPEVSYNTGSPAQPRTIKFSRASWDGVGPAGPRHGPKHFTTAPIAG